MLNLQPTDKYLRHTLWLQGRRLQKRWLKTCLSFQNKTSKDMWRSIDILAFLHGCKHHKHKEKERTKKEQRNFLSTLNQIPETSDPFHFCPQDLTALAKELRELRQGEETSRPPVKVTDYSSSSEDSHSSEDEEGEGGANDGTVAVSDIPRIMWVYVLVFW